MIAPFSQALELLKNNHPNQAITVLQDILNKHPKDAKSWHLLGGCYYVLTNYSLAVEFLRKAVELEPNNGEYQRNYACALYNNNNLHDCIRHGLKAIALKPNSDAYEMPARAHYILGHYDEAKSLLAEGIRNYPIPSTIYEFALILLLHGNYEEGFELLRHRKPVHWAKDPERYKKIWNGESLEEKRLLISKDLGFGDEIQFSRYLPLIKEKYPNATIILEVEPSLEHLFQASFGSVVSQFENNIYTGPFDYCISIIHLPSIFKTTVDTIPSKASYLKLNPAWSKPFDNIISSSSHPKVGICWRGRASHGQDIFRSISLPQFSKLLSIPNIDFYSLQYGKDNTELNTIDSSNLIDLSPYLHDFADTLGAISKLDLIITVDTSIAHLTSAFGKPAWVLLPFSPDWRWMLHQEKSAWYPTAHLFRQVEFNEWSKVLDNVANELKQLKTPMHA